MFSWIKHQEAFKALEGGLLYNILLKKNYEKGAQADAPSRQNCVNRSGEKEDALLARYNALKKIKSGTLQWGVHSVEA